MARLTVWKDGCWQGDPSAAVEKLAAFEDLVDQLAQSQAQLARQLSALRAQGREKTAQFRQLLAQKLTQAQLLALFEARGLGPGAPCKPDEPGDTAH